MKRSAGWLPIIMGTVLVVLVAALSVHKFAEWSGFRLLLGIGVTAFYLFWCFAEGKLASAKEVSLPPTRRDARSLEFYALAQGTTVVCALLFSTVWVGYWFNGAAIAVLLAGFAFRIQSIRALGQFYSRRVRLLEGHEVITNGPYRVVRHPAYLGTLIGHLGFVLFFFNWPALIIWALFFAPMVVRRILIEEPVLFELPGYSEYAARTRRLIPPLW